MKSFVDLNCVVELNKGSSYSPYVITLRLIDKMPFNTNYVKKIYFPGGVQFTLLFFIYIDQNTTCVLLMLEHLQLM